MRFRSLRTQLTWTYAGLGLLTAVILGAILVAVLASYYGSAQHAYLIAASERIVQRPLRSQDASGYGQWAKFAALETQTRVKLVSGNGAVIADSGSPDQIDPRTLAPRGDAHGGNGAGDGAPRPDRLPGPLGGGIFGTAANSPRSPASLTVAVRGTGLPSGAQLILSEAPASGSDVLLGVAQAWLVAAVLAVAMSAAAGWFVATRIARPIDVLTDASDRMAEGDLSARADVTRDDELGRLADSFNVMADRTQTTVTTLRRFVGDAAHEIGTPLTALAADLELAADRIEGDDEHRLIQRALGQAGRLEALSANLLRLSRLEAADQALEVQRLDLNQSALRSADAVASRAEQAGVEFALDLAEDPLPIMADVDKLGVAIDNLLGNAVKFTSAGGAVTLGTTRDGESAVLWVVDTGVGIPEAERAEVFERFHRARNVASIPGSGLGLAIVKATAQRLGGAVSLTSGDAGTRVELRFPLA